LAVYYDEFNRHLERLKRATAEVRVGKLSGAVGTFANVDPRVERYVCRKLGLQPAPISTQIVERDLHSNFVSTLALIGASIENLAVEIRHIQRDRHAELLSALAITASTLEKGALEIRGLQKTEIGEVEEPFAKGQKGSSAMPHKKNPVVCEQMTGLARLLRSYSIAALENVTLWHERDISHSSVERVILPDATILLDYMLYKMTGLIEALVVNKEQMLKNLGLTQGVVFSGQVLLALMRHGFSRTQAYECVQAVALNAWRSGQRFEDALEKDEAIRAVLSPAERKRCVDPAVHMKHVDTIFKRVGLEK
jgi:adenylosuccinate lyase